MLLQAGGSGSINPMTGLPEFQPMDYSLAEDFEQLPDMVETTPAPEFNIQPYTPPASVFQTPLGAPEITPIEPSFRTEVGIPPVRSRVPALPEPRVVDQFSYVPPVEFSKEVYGGAEQPGVLSRIEGAGRKFEQFTKDMPTTTRLGFGGVNLGLAALLARRAGREREAYANELRGMAQPYAQAQQEALARAQGGGMTAPQQRAFDIAQARARQGLSAQNLGAGSAAAGIQTAQAQRARTMARQESFDAALDAARIRDSYLREAARQELAADTDLANALIGVLQGEIREATTTQASAPQQQRRP